MMKRQCKFMRSVGFLCAICGIAGPLLGQASPASAPPGQGGLADGALEHLSLAKAQQVALERNWDLLAAAAGVDAATAQKIVAHEYPNPTLSFSSAKINVDSHPNSTPGGNGLWDRSYDTVAAINQLVEIGGKRRKRQVSAQAGVEESRALFYDTQRTLDLGVAKAYIAAAQAREMVEVLRQSAASLREEDRIAGQRLRAGEISSADKDQIEIAAERFELDARSAESSAAQARVSLEVLLAAPCPKADCRLVDRLEDLAVSTLPPGSNGSGWWRPDVLASEAALRKAEADLGLQKAYRIPDPTFLAQYEHNPADSPNSVGLGVSFPLPLWNRNRGNILAAAASREQALLALEKARAQAAADIATALLAYDDASRRWFKYRDRLRPQSAQVRATKDFAYQKGGASLLDMLVAERDDNDVRLAALQAAGDMASALAGLKAATVEIQPSQIKQ